MEANLICHPFCTHTHTHFLYIYPICCVLTIFYLDLLEIQPSRFLHFLQPHLLKVVSIPIKISSPCCFSALLAAFFCFQCNNHWRYAFTINSTYIPGRVTQIGSYQIHQSVFILFHEDYIVSLDSFKIGTGFPSSKY